MKKQFHIYLLITFLGILNASSLFSSSALADISTNGPKLNLCELARKIKDSQLIELCANIKYLGFGTFGALNLIPKNLDIRLALNNDASGRDEVSAERHDFEYDQFIISVKTDSQQNLDIILRTANALKKLKNSNRRAYEFIRTTMTYPTAPSLSKNLWKNRNEQIIFSFDKTPVFIGASGTLIGQASNDHGIDFFRNYAIVSIDEETILGTDDNLGSKPIYKRQSPKDNYVLYMNDGLLFTMVHELVHQYISYRNSSSSLANAIYLARNRNQAAVDQIAEKARLDAVTNAEEIIANETAIMILGNTISQEQKDAIVRENDIIVQKAGVREFLAKLATIRISSENVLVVPDGL